MEIRQWLEETTAAEIMQRQVVTLMADDLLVAVIQNMVNAHIHRVVVLDEQRRLHGIISTTDVVAALLRQ